MPSARRSTGLTTAATVWVTAALGIACGLGAWVIVGVTVTLALLVLAGLAGLDDAIARRAARQPAARRSRVKSDQSSWMFAFLIASAHLAASLRRYSENSCGVLCSTSVPASMSFCRTTGSATAAT